MKELDIEKAEHQQARAAARAAADRPDLRRQLRPASSKDEEKKRVLAAIDEKIAGKQIVVTERQEPARAARSSTSSRRCARASRRARPPPRRAPRAAEPPVAEAEEAAARSARAPSVPRRPVAAEAGPAPPQRAQEVIDESGCRPTALRDIQSMLGLSAGVITGLIAAGFVTPEPRQAARIPLQLPGRGAAAHRLQPAGGADPAAQDPALAAAAQGDAAEELPLTGLRIAAVGNDIAVEEADANGRPNRASC
jgi:hypothetical protein